MTRYSAISITLCRGVLATGLLTAALALQANDQDDKQKKDASHHAGKADTLEARLKGAAKMNLASMKYGQLAAQKAENQQLKQFGQTLEQDHRQAQNELQRIAQKHNVTLPTSVDEKCKEEVAKLQAKSGREFDQEFAKGAIQGHAMAVQHLQEASRNAKEADVREYLQETLTKVKQHQDKGRQIAMTLGIDQATIASLEREAQEAAVGGAAQSETETSTQQGQQSTQPKQQSSQQGQQSLDRDNK